MVATFPPGTCPMKSFENDNKTRTDGQNDTRRTLSDFEKETKMLFWLLALYLKEFQCDLSGGHVSCTLLGRGGKLGPINGPLPFFVF